MSLPDLILLNGSTSSGKTAICKALQEILPAGYLHFSIDDVFPWTPSRWHGSSEGFRMEPLPGGEIAILIGPEARKILSGWRHMVRAALDEGLRVIVDEVFLEAGDLAEWAAVMRGRDVFFVGVRCDLAELQRRELARGDRGVGQALCRRSLRPDPPRRPAEAKAPDRLRAARLGGTRRHRLDHEQTGVLGSPDLGELLERYETHGLIERPRPFVGFVGEGGPPGLDGQIRPSERAGLGEGLADKRPAHPAPVGKRANGRQMDIDRGEAVVDEDHDAKRVPGGLRDPRRLALGQGRVFGVRLRDAEPLGQLGEDGGAVRAGGPAHDVNLHGDPITV